MTSKSLRIQEYDEAGKITATYAQSEGINEGVNRLDFIVGRARLSDLV